MGILRVYRDNFPQIEKTSLFVSLLKWLKVYIDGPIIILRKLVSVLSLFALKTIPELWNRPIHYLTVFLVFDEEVQFDNMIIIPDIKHLVGLLNHNQKKALLMFSSSFIEEIGNDNISLSKR